jgi:hypothetical protein
LRRRVAHAALSNLTFSRVVPALGSDVLASRWERRPLTARGVAANFGWTLAGDLQTRCLDEFGPDLKRIGKRIGRALLRRRSIKLP